MRLTKSVNGKRVPVPPQEEARLLAERQAEQQAAAARAQAEQQREQALQSTLTALDRFPEGPISTSQAIDKVVELIDYLRAKFPDDAR